MKIKTREVRFRDKGSMTPGWALYLSDKIVMSTAGDAFRSLPDAWLGQLPIHPTTAATPEGLIWLSRTPASAFERLVTSANEGIPSLWIHGYNSLRETALGMAAYSPGVQAKPFFTAHEPSTRDVVLAKDAGYFHQAADHDAWLGHALFALEVSGKVLGRYVKASTRAPRRSQAAAPQAPWLNGPSLRGGWMDELPGAPLGA